MNNPFGLPDEVMNAIIASATKNMMSGCRAGGVRPNPFEPPTSKQNDTLAEDAAKMAKAQRKSMIPLLLQVSMMCRRSNY